MQWQWEPIIQALVTVLPLAVTAGAAWLQAHKHTQLAAAVQTGGGVAYNALVSANRDGVTDWRAAEAVAIRQGVAAVQQIVGSVDPAKVATQVAGALGHLQAVDPTIAAGGGSTATATAAPGQSATAEAGPARLTEVT
jgi:hypothetical protein